MTLGPRILVIDDEPQIRQFIDISLRSQGYDTALAADGEAGLEALRKEGADVVLLDLGLPGMDGEAVLARIRRGSGVPVIILTVRADEAKKVALLDSGANDYVTKPFGIEELMARIRALLRSSGREAAAPIYDDGYLRIDHAAHQVFIRGEPVLLTRKEFALLAALARQPGRLLTQAKLLREVWGPTHVEDTHYLRILVGKLRQKLGDQAADPTYILTEPGVGLRFASNEPPQS